MKLRPSPIGFQSANQSALIDNRFKLVRLGVPTRPTGKKKRRAKKAGAAKPQLLLFDIQADPSESHDISARHPEVVQKMIASLDAWQRSCRMSFKQDRR